MMVQQPGDHNVRRCLYNGKYKDTILKVQLIIDFLGRIVYFSGPHIGNKYDGHIYRETYHEHPVSEQEYLLGDGHYTNIPHIITPPSQPPGGHMSDVDYAKSVIVSHYRSRVEHVNRLAEAHGLFKEHFRGSIDVLSSAIRVTAQLTNIECCKYLRYMPVGPWEHFPQ